MHKWRWYVYILRCKDDSYYVGMTWKLDRRFEQHLFKFGSKYTSKHIVRELVYQEEYDDLKQARKREKQLKGWSRKKKEKLIKGKWGRW